MPVVVLMHVGIFWKEVAEGTLVIPEGCRGDGWNSLASEQEYSLSPAKLVPKKAPRLVISVDQRKEKGKQTLSYAEVALSGARQRTAMSGRLVHHQNSHHTVASSFPGLSYWPELSFKGKAVYRACLLRCKRKRAHLGLDTVSGMCHGQSPIITEPSVSKKNASGQSCPLGALKKKLIWR